MPNATTQLHKAAERTHHESSEKSLLEQIYDGEFSSRELIIRKKPEYRQFLIRSSDATKALLGRLGNEDRNRLDTIPRPPQSARFHGQLQHVCLLSAHRRAAHLQSLSQ